MRGRVMALWFVALQGTTPIGGPLIGGIISLAGARVGLGVGALACVLAAGLGYGARRRLRRRRAAPFAVRATAAALPPAAPVARPF
jgi:MFS family permease